MEIISVLNPALRYRFSTGSRWFFAEVTNASRLAAGSVISRKGLPFSIISRPSIQTSRKPNRRGSECSTVPPSRSSTASAWYRYGSSVSHRCASRHGQVKLNSCTSSPVSFSRAGNCFTAASRSYGRTTNRAPASPVSFCGFATRS